MYGNSAKYMIHNGAEWSHQHRGQEDSPSCSSYENSMHDSYRGPSGASHDSMAPGGFLKYSLGSSQHKESFTEIMRDANGFNTPTYPSRHGISDITSASDTLNLPSAVNEFSW